VFYSHKGLLDTATSSLRSLLGLRFIIPVSYIAPYLLSIYECVFLCIYCIKYGTNKTNFFIYQVVLTSNVIVTSAVSAIC